MMRQAWSRRLCTLMICGAAAGCTGDDAADPPPDGDSTHPSSEGSPDAAVPASDDGGNPAPPTAGMNDVDSAPPRADGAGGDSEDGSGGEPNDSAGAAAGTMAMDDNTQDVETPDAGVPGTLPVAGPPAEAEPGEPVFIAMGDGGWLATSCDRGRTWTTSAFSGTTGDLTHTSWSAFGGLAFGDHGFIAGFGWGSGGHIAHSSDGRGFRELGAVFDGGPYNQVTAAALYTGEAYVLLNSKYSAWTSTDGLNFEKSPLTLPGPADQIRQARAFPRADGLIVVAAENQSGKDHRVGNFILTSEDAGTSWIEGTGLDPNCLSRIQIGGGDIAYRQGVLLIGGDAHCRSTDNGKTFSSADKPGSARTTDLFHDASGFVAIAGGRAYHSANGSAWDELGVIGDGAYLGDYGGGTYAAVNKEGTAFYYSDDGKQWSAGQVSDGPRGGAAVRDFIVGHFDEACP